MLCIYENNSAKVFDMKNFHAIQDLKFPCDYTEPKMHFVK